MVLYHIDLVSLSSDSKVILGVNDSSDLKVNLGGDDFSLLISQVKDRHI